MTDDLIERMVEAGEAAVWDLILSGDAKGAKAVTKTTRACLAAALTEMVEFVGKATVVGNELRNIADRLEKGDG